MKNKNYKKRGFISIILIVVGALVLLKYVYSIDVIGFLTQGRFKELLDQFYSLGSEGWSRYRDVIIRLWDFLFGFIKDLAAKIK